MATTIHLHVASFAQDHLPEITGTVGLVSYALLRNKLTPAGIVAGILVAGVHMLHPWRAFFWLLMVFFLVGTLVTRVRFFFHPCCFIPTQTHPSHDRFLTWKSFQPKSVICYKRFLQSLTCGVFSRHG
jgi:MFS family permease